MQELIAAFADTRVIRKLTESPDLIGPFDAFIRAHHSSENITEAELDGLYDAFIAQLPKAQPIPTGGIMTLDTPADITAPMLTDDYRLMVLAKHRAYENAARRRAAFKKGCRMGSINYTHKHYQRYTRGSSRRYRRRGGY